MPAPAAPLIQPHPPSADFADMMEVDDVDISSPVDEVQSIQRSTKVTAHVKNIERVQWQSRPPIFESSDSDSTSEEQDYIDDRSEESSGSESDGSSESQLDEDNGFLLAWELWGEEFEREAHSLGVLS
jgi:hypothetical protein